MILNEYNTLKLTKKGNNFMESKLTMLMILDGFGIAPESDGNAVAAASKPNYDRLVANYPHSELQEHTTCL